MKRSSIPEWLSLLKDQELINQMKEYFKKLTSSRLSRINESAIEGEIILDFDHETYRRILATYDYLKNSFKTQFDSIVKREREVKQEINRVSKKIKQGEVRKDNPLAQKLREEKTEWKEEGRGTRI